MLIRKGAEANLYLKNWYGKKVIFKSRVSKKYRVPEMDREIQIQRTKHEPQIMHKAKEAGVSTPIIFLIDLSSATIVMEYIEGEQIKHVLDRLSIKERKNLCYNIGKYIGKLHMNGIVHGDLTTSNMILTSEGKIVFIDFGLSEQSWEIEDRGVDLHLMKKAIASTHFMYVDECFDAVIKGYESIVGEKMTSQVLEKIGEIEKRGRYISQR